MRAVALAVLLAIASVLIVIGASMLSVAVGYLVGGALLAGWSVLVLAEPPA